MTPTGIPAAVSPDIGKYHLIAELARGGMGNVYLAVTRGPGGFHKLLVVKELRPEFADDEMYVAMFLEEARLAARLTHPNIVQTNEVGSDGKRHYMIMEYLDGRSLYRVVKHFARTTGFPVGAQLRVIAEALVGLHYAHELCGFDGEPLGIVHRDVSPLNVLVTFDGQAKALDFGVAKSVDSSLETQAGVLKGRIAYMAPEQARGGKCDRRVDVYAAGVMIWEAAAGRRLWAGKSDLEILTKTLGEGPPRLRSVNPKAHPDLDALCARAMAIEPGDRHPTAEALLDDLAGHLQRRGDAMSMREIGAIVSGAFEPERRRMREIIEDVLASMRAAPRSGVMPTLATQPFVPATQTFTVPRRLDGIPNVSSLLIATPTLQRVAERSARSFSAVRTPRPTVPDGADRGLERRGRVALVAGAVAGACLAFVVVQHLRSLGVGVPAPAPVPAAAPVPAPAPAAAPAPAPAASPAPAPAPAPQGAPTMASIPRWTTPARWASAPATPRAPKTDPTEPARQGSTPSDAPAPATQTSRPEVDPGGGRAPLRPIVTANPYGPR